jgi:flagellin-specific chaperone FliS
MVYFIFDLDETLAELYSVYYFVTSLRLESGSLESNLDKAYQYFVRDILLTEISNEPLGILRPGILGIMKKLKNLQKVGKIKNVLIYSNNGDIKSLEFIKDLIHLYVGEGLIKECIHRNHHMRANERVNAPHLINKTWNVLRNIMINGNTRAATNLVTTDVYFFDDLDHPDLRKKLGMNYYKVPKYDYKASVNRIGEIYKNAIYRANIKGAKLKKYVNIILDDYAINGSNTITYDTSINGVIQLLKDNTLGNELNNSILISLPPPPDIGILMMDHAINRVQIKNELRRIKKRQLGQRNSKIQTKRRKLVNKEKQDLEVVGESISQ